MAKDRLGQLHYHMVRHVWRSTSVRVKLTTYNSSAYKHTPYWGCFTKIKSKVYMPHRYITEHNIFWQLSEPCVPIFKGYHHTPVGGTQQNMSILCVHISKKKTLCLNYSKRDPPQSFKRCYLIVIKVN